MEKKGDKFKINGEKTYISGVRETLKYGGGFVTVVKTEPKLRHKGISLCFLPIKEIKGVSTSIFRDMGREGISTGSFTLQDVEIPEYYLIGELNKGFYYAMEGFNGARVLVSAACIGAAEKVLELGIEYLKARELFESKLAKFQGIQFQLAEHYTKLETARLLVYKAAWMLDQWYETKRFTINEVNKAIAMAKLIAPMNAFDIIKEVMIWHGAYGYTKEAGLEMGLRGITSYIIGAEGAQNIMRVIIARELLGKEFIK